MTEREVSINNFVLVDGLIAKIIGFYSANDEVDIEYQDDLNKVSYMNNESRDFKDLEPIPLTEEWLVRLGFEKTYDKALPYQDAYSKEGLIFDGEFQLTVEGKESDLHGIGKPLKHVHQLQNLYFALTGEEIKEVTPKPTAK